MKIKKPAEEIEVCDHCQHGGYLETCIVCGRQHCLSCQGMIAGCWVGPKVCKECDDREDVKRVVARYADQITPIIKKRTAALKRLSSNAAADLRREENDGHEEKRGGTCSASGLKGEDHVA